MSKATLRTFIAHVEDLPGVLNRVTSLLRRRNYNIVSLTVGRTERPGVSRMTIVLEADDDGARRIEANLYKLVNVLWVQDTNEAATIVREVALVKVRADSANRSEVMQLCAALQARVVDVGREALIVEITDTGEKIAGLLEVLQPFGIVEMVRTGAVAMLSTSEASEPSDDARTPSSPKPPSPSTEGGVRAA